jgi:hypothetical protein
MDKNVQNVHVQNQRTIFSWENHQYWQFNRPYMARKRTVAAICCWYSHGVYFFMDATKLLQKFIIHIMQYCLKITLKLLPIWIGSLPINNSMQNSYCSCLPIWFDQQSQLLEKNAARDLDRLLTDERLGWATHRRGVKLAGAPGRICGRPR